MSVSPAFGNTSGQTFTFTFSDSNGWQNVQPDFIINRFLDGRQGCYVALRPFDATHWSVLLVDDAGDAGGPFSRFDTLPIDGTPGSGVAQNSQCTINGSGSSMMGNGNTLTVNLAITFNASFGGNKQIIMSAGDAVSNANSGWQPSGVVGVLPVPTNGPQVGGVNPGHSSGTGQIYTFTFTDTNGWQDITLVDVLTNLFLDGRQACYLAFRAERRKSRYGVSGGRRGRRWNEPATFRPGNRRHSIEQPMHHQRHGQLVECKREYIPADAQYLVQPTPLPAIGCSSWRHATTPRPRIPIGRLRERSR